MKENVAYTTTHCGSNFVSAYCIYSDIDSCGYSYPASSVIQLNPHNSTDVQDGSTSDSSYFNTPSWTALENDGYSDPRYYGEEGRRHEATRGLAATPRAITGEESGYPNQPDTGGVDSTTHNTPDTSWTDMEYDGYSDPRYYNEEGRSPEATPGAITGEETKHITTPDVGRTHTPALESDC